MPLKYLFCLANVLALAAPCLAAGRLSFADLPPKVQERVQESAPTGEIQRIYRAYNEGRKDPDYYVVLNEEGKRVILWMTTEGKVLSNKKGPIPAFEEFRKPPPGSELYGTFEGKFPCEDCQRVKVALTLHRNAKDKSPTTYLLQRVGVAKGNESLISKGTWKREKGKGKDKGSAYVRLEGEAPQEYALYLAVGENLLLLADADGEPRVGNSAHSFTLSRSDWEP